MKHYLLATMTMLALALPSQVLAFTPPRVGNQYLTLGLSLQPGVLSDPGARATPTASFGQATMLRLGLQHVVAPSLYMGFEVEVGSQFMNEHSASADGLAPSSSTFAWQLAFLARWIPGGDDGGVHAGAGLQWFNANLEDDEGLQILGLDLRSGFYVWRDEDFSLLEFGYVVPFISGLELPTDFSGEREPPVEDTWTLHRFMISFSYGW